MFRLSQISEFTPQLLQMLPPSQWMAMDAGISPLSFSSLTPWCRLVALVCSFFPLPPVPSFLCPTEFCMDPDIPSQCSGSPSSAHLVSVRTAASLDVPDAPWREVNPTSTHHSGILSTHICAHIRNEFPFLLSNIAITTHVELLLFEENTGNFHSLQFSQSSFMANYMRPHGLQHAKLPCTSQTPRA